MNEYQRFDLCDLIGSNTLWNYAIKQFKNAQFHGSHKHLITIILSKVRYIYKIHWNLEGRYEDLSLCEQLWKQSDNTMQLLREIRLRIIDLIASKYLFTIGLSECNELNHVN
eukprot:11069_1